MNKAKLFLKHNPFTVFAYNTYLNFCCRNVEAYIFAATTGRSGSKSLTEIFQAAEKTICLHEPHPVMFNNCPPNVDKIIYFNDMFRVLKRIYIKRAAVGHRYYLETNHQFLKNFIVPAIEEFQEKIRIIHLVRDPVSVAASFYEIGSVPGLTERGRYYLLDPESKENIINLSNLLEKESDFMDPIYRCLWYWYEVEARILEMKKRFADTTFYKISTEDLNSYEEMKAMFHAIGVSYDYKKLEKLVGVRSNQRKWDKDREINLHLLQDKNDRLYKLINENYPYIQIN